MEFDFNINELFGRRETVYISDKVTPFTNSPETYNEDRACMLKVIDILGRLSAQAQGLRLPITSGSRFLGSKHHLYVIKELTSNTGKGTAVGILKTGYKRLFLFDNQGKQREVTPLCVLDFYVHESRQRQGLGKRLFDFMLKHQCVNVKHLAVDRPSYKFLSFIQKHYNLKQVTNQTFNFVIFEGFFINRPTDVPKRPTSRLSPTFEQSYITESNGIDKLSLNPFDATHPYRTSTNGLGVYSRYSTPTVYASHIPSDEGSVLHTSDDQSSKEKQIVQDGTAVSRLCENAQTLPPQPQKVMSQTDFSNKRCSDTNTNHSTSPTVDYSIKTISPTALIKSPNVENLKKSALPILPHNSNILHKPPTNRRSDNAYYYKPNSDHVATYLRRARDTKLHIFGIPQLRNQTNP